MKKILFALLAATMLIGCQEKKDDNVIKIGAILPLTGYASTNGDMARKAIDMAIDSLNSSKGYTYEVVYEDSKSFPKEAAICYNKLRMQGIKYMIGFGGATLYSFIPQTNNRDEILFATAAPNEDLLSFSNRCVRIYPSVHMIVDSLIDYVKNNGFKNVGVIYIQNEVYAQYATSFKSKLEQENISLTFYEGYDPSLTDFKNIINKLASHNIDCIYLASTGESTGKIIRQIYQTPQINNSVPIIGDFSLANSENLKIIGDLKSPVHVVNTSIDAKFVAEFENKYKETPNAFAAYSFVIPIILDQLLKEYGRECETENLCRNLFNGKFNTIVGPIAFDENSREPLMLLSVYPL